MPVDYNSPVWDDAKRVDIASRCLTRLAKKFKVESVNAQIAGPHTGRIYNNGSGVGFRRYHQASARGEFAAPDTTNLINSMEDEKLSPLQHQVFVDDGKAPYGKWVADPNVLGRKVFVDKEQFLTGIGLEEIRKAEQEMVGSAGATL